MTEFSIDFFVAYWWSILALAVVLYIAWNRMRGLPMPRLPLVPAVLAALLMLGACFDLAGTSIDTIRVDFVIP